MEPIRTFLVDLVQRIDDRVLDDNDMFALGMIAMVVKNQKSGHSAPSDETEALRYLSVGWFVNSMMTKDPERPKNENKV